MHAYVPLSALESPAPVLARLLAADGDAFVREAYRALLGREPDPVGWRDGLARLESGAPRMALLADLARSPEAATVGPAHRALGAFVLGRSSEQGAAPSSLSALLALEDGEFVRAAYRIVLGRDADEEGANHYAGWLRAGEPKVDVLRVLRASAEARERGGAGDAALLAAIDREIAHDAWARLPVLGPVIAQLSGLESRSQAAKQARRAGNRAAREAASDSSLASAFPGDDAAPGEGAPRSAADISARLITLPPAFAGAPHSRTA